LIKYAYHTVKNSNVLTRAKASPDELVLIENIPNNDQLLENFLATLGDPIQEERNQEAGSIFHVNVEKNDTHFISYANSNLFFPVHTDGSDFKIPPNYVAMFCVRPSQEGGESLFVKLSDLIANLPKELLDVLTKKQWLFNTIHRTIITQTETATSICYNRLMIESYGKLTQQELDILNHLDRICEEHTFNFKLKANDLILFRNDRFLHGRADFPLDSKRLLKRVRFCEPDLPAGRSV